jgi:hypothetical protein
MPDDPKKRGKQDRSRVSKQEHEQRYQRTKGAGAGRSTKKTGARQSGGKR